MGTLPTLLGLSQPCRMVTFLCKAKCNESEENCPPNDIQREHSYPKAFQGDGSNIPEQPGVLRHKWDMQPYKAG